MENNLLTHTKHETTHFEVLSDKRQTAKVTFLPFAGKANVKLNLSNKSVIYCSILTLICRFFLGSWIWFVMIKSIRPVFCHSWSSKN